MADKAAQDYIAEKRAQIQSQARAGRPPRVPAQYTGGKARQFSETGGLSDDAVMQTRLPTKDINLPVERKPLRAGRSMRRR